MDAVKLNFSRDEERILDTLVSKGYFDSREQIVAIGVRRIINECRGQLERLKDEDEVLKISVATPFPTATRRERTRAIERLMESGI